MSGLPALPRDIPTPALVLEIDRLRDNIGSMARAMSIRNVALRPHAKTHKSTDIAAMQIAEGATGLTVATLGEAENFAEAGFDDLFIAYPLWASDATAGRIASLSQVSRLRVGVESEASAVALARASKSLEVVLELDSGLQRTGVKPDEVVMLARQCSDLGLRIAGVFTHGGHGYASPQSTSLAAADEARCISDAVELLARDGFDVEVASAGSTPTALASATGAVNEERPGIYVFYDRQQLALSVCDIDEIAAFVMSTVVSVTDDEHFVIDAGTKALAGDRAQWLEGYGALCGFQDATVARLWEHHGIVRSRGPETPQVGDVVAVIPNHICTVVNLFDYYVVSAGGQVVDRWRIAARGR